MFLALVGAVNMMKWLFRALYWPGQVQYVRKQLRAFDATHREPGILAKFTENYLRRDGMFIIRLVGLNMGEVVPQRRTARVMACNQYVTHGRGGRRGGALWTVEQLQSGAPTDRREVGPQEDEQESTERTSAGSDVTVMTCDRDERRRRVASFHGAPVG